MDRDTNSSASGNNSSNRCSLAFLFRQMNTIGPAEAAAPSPIATSSDDVSIHPRMNPAMKPRMQVCTRRAGAQRIPACSSRIAILGPSWNLSTIFWATRLLAPVSCCMTLASPLTLAVFPFFALPVPDRRALMRSRSLDFTYLETTNHASMNAAQIATSTIMKFICLPRFPFPSASDFQDLIEQVRPQTDAGAQQFFVELGPDAGGRETPHHLTIRIQSPLFEHE